MTTGPISAAVAPPELYNAIVAKARLLSVKDPVWREPSASQDIMNSVLVSAALATKTEAHHVHSKDVIEWLNVT